MDNPSMLIFIKKLDIAKKVLKRNQCMQYQNINVTTIN